MAGNRCLSFPTLAFNMKSLIELGTQLLHVVLRPPQVPYGPGMPSQMHTHPYTLTHSHKHIITNNKIIIKYYFILYIIIHNVLYIIL